MQHIKIIFRVTGAESEMLIASLAHAGYEGFEETETELFAYISEEAFREEVLKDIVSAYNVVYSIETIPAQNWNEVWESNFEPVVVPGFCTIRAHFHNITTQTPYNIIITPKMSFGTGHHATTQQMMLLMKDVPFNNRSVLDFGTGTGVLAILAAMLGAGHIVAIDNDEWSVENATENVARNNCEGVTIKQGSLEAVQDVKFDIILANINRNILLQYMHMLSGCLSSNGIILMSGLLVEDRDTIAEAAEREGFTLCQQTEQKGWIALRFDK